jgi:hypothetical protein
MWAIVVGILTLAAIGIGATSSPAPQMGVAMIASPPKSALPPAADDSIAQPLDVHGTLTLSPDLLALIARDSIRQTVSFASNSTLRELTLVNEAPSAAPGTDIGFGSVGIADSVAALMSVFQRIAMPVGVYLGISGPIANLLNIGAGNFKRAIFMSPDIEATRLSAAMLDTIKLISKSELSEDVQRLLFLSFITLSKVSKAQLEHLAGINSGKDFGTQTEQIVALFKDAPVLNASALSSDLPRELRRGLRPLIEQIEKTYGAHYETEAKGASLEKFRLQQRTNWLALFRSAHTQVNLYAPAGSLFLSNLSWRRTAEMYAQGGIELVTGSMTAQHTMASISSRLVAEDRPSAWVYICRLGLDMKETLAQQSFMRNFETLRDATSRDSGLFCPSLVSGGTITYEVPTLAMGIEQIRRSLIVPREEEHIAATSESTRTKASTVHPKTPKQAPGPLSQRAKQKSVQKPKFGRRASEQM